MPAKKAQLSVEPVERARETDAVRDYDELDEIVRDELGDIATSNSSTLTVDSFAAALVDDYECDVIKFTDYYRIDRV